MKPFGKSSKALLQLFVYLCSLAASASGQASTASVMPEQTSGQATPASGTATGNAASALAHQGYDTPNDNQIDSSNNRDGKVADQNPFEDWYTLKIPSDLKTDEPMPPIIAQRPEFTREFVQATWRPEDVIDLYVIKPVGVKNPPVILYLYSFPTDTDRFKTDDFARLVTSKGFAAVGFVSALTGQRFHDRPTKEWFVSELPEALGKSVHDVQFILNCLEKRGDLDMTRVGMFGDGSGASIAIMTASVDPRIKALDLFDPWGDWPDWIAKSSLILLEDERATYLKPDFLKKVENLDPVKYLPQLKTQEVRVQYLDTDTVTPKLAREHMQSATPSNAKVVHYADTKEFMKTAGQDGELLDWLKEQLVPALAGQRVGVGSPTQASYADQASSH